MTHNVMCNFSISFQICFSFLRRKKNENEFIYLFIDERTQVVVKNVKKGNAYETEYIFKSIVFFHTQ